MNDEAQKQFYDRLQPLRTGDYGGDASTKAEAHEVAATIRALRYCATTVGLDDDEQALLTRLST